MPRETKKPKWSRLFETEPNVSSAGAVYFKPLSQEQIDALAQADLAALRWVTSSPFA